MDTKKLKRLGKFLSLVLRHKPETIGIEISSSGWTDTGILIEKMNAYGKKIDLETLRAIVANNNKKRYSFNADESKIRANQGHSLKVDLGYAEKMPPEILYHGTARRNLDSIFKTGLEKRNRHHVHLSRDMETAVSVGQRHGKVVVLKVSAAEMQKAGFVFFESDNGVWLTEQVPADYLSLGE